MYWIWWLSGYLAFFHFGLGLTNPPASGTATRYYYIMWGEDQVNTWNAGELQLGWYVWVLPFITKTTSILRLSPLFSNEGSQQSSSPVFVLAEPAGHEPSIFYPQLVVELPNYHRHLRRHPTDGSALPLLEWRLHKLWVCPAIDVYKKLIFLSQGAVQLWRLFSESLKNVSPRTDSGRK